VVGTGLFAQELKLSGYFNSGLGFIATDQKTADPGNPTQSNRVDPYFTAFGVDSASSGYRFRLNASYTGQDGNAGVQARFQSQATSATPISIPFAYGWVKPFDFLRVSGGLVDDVTWNSGGAILNDDQGEGLGTLVRVTPVKGLDLGVGIYVLTTQSGNANNALPFTLANINKKWYETKYTANAGYTLPDLFKFTFTYRSRSATGLTSINNGQISSRAIIGAQILAVKDLIGVFEFEIDNIGDTFNTTGSLTGLLNFYETVAYKAGDLGLGLNAIQFVKHQSQKGDPGLQFNPWVSYALGSIVPRLDLVYFSGGRAALNYSSTSATRGKYFYLGTVGAYTPDYDRDFYAFTIRPSVKFNVDTAVVELGDVINIEHGPSGTYQHPEDTKKASRLTNVLYVDFKWTF
jgi:hypothetical protein